MRHLILHIFGVRVWGAPSWREKRQGGDIRYPFYFLSSFRKYRFTNAKNQSKWSNALANVKFYPNLAIFPRQKFSHVFILEIQNLYNPLNTCP